MDGVITELPPAMRQRTQAVPPRYLLSCFSQLLMIVYSTAHCRSVKPLTKVLSPKRGIFLVPAVPRGAPAWVFRCPGGRPVGRTGIEGRKRRRRAGEGSLRDSPAPAARGANAAGSRGTVRPAGCGPGRGKGSPRGEPGSLARTSPSPHRSLLQNNLHQELVSSGGTLCRSPFSLLCLPGLRVPHESSLQAFLFAAISAGSAGGEMRDRSSAGQEISWRSAPEM